MCSWHDARELSNGVRTFTLLLGGGRVRSDMGISIWATGRRTFVSIRVVSGFRNMLFGLRDMAFHILSVVHSHQHRLPSDRVFALQLACLP